MQNLMRQFFEDESGATAIEYGLIAALIAVATIAGASLMGNSVSDLFNNIITATFQANIDRGSGG